MKSRINRCFDKKLFCQFLNQCFLQYLGKIQLIIQSPRLLEYVLEFLGEFQLYDEVPQIPFPFMD